MFITKVIPVANFNIKSAQEVLDQIVYNEDHRQGVEVWVPRTKELEKQLSEMRGMFWQYIVTGHNDSLFKIERYDRDGFIGKLNAADVRIMEELDDYVIVVGL